MPTFRVTVAVAVIAIVLATPLQAQADQATFFVDLASDLASLDPHLQWDQDSYTAYRDIFDNLLTRGKDGAIIPQVAASWRYQDDTHVVFTIRDGISFQDGTKLTAEDVAFSIRRIMDPPFKSPQLSQFDQISGVEVTGPLEVRVTTRSTYPVLLAQLTKLSIVPRAVVERLGDGFSQAPVGSGPYKLVRRTQGVSIVLAATEGYWRGKPPFPQVELRPVTDESTRIADVPTGRADIARILSMDNADRLRNDAMLRVLWTPTERVTMVTLHTLDGATRDMRVRAPVAHAIDRDTIVEALLKGVDQRRYRNQGKCEYPVYCGADQRRAPALIYRHEQRFRLGGLRAGANAAQARGTRSGIGRARARAPALPAQHATPHFGDN